MRLYAQRAFVCLTCGETIFAGEAMDAERGTYYTPGYIGGVTSDQVLPATGKHFTETGHTTYRAEDRLLYQPQP